MVEAQKQPESNTQSPKLIMSTPCMKKFQKAMQNEIEQVVHQLAGHFKFDGEEAVKFIKSGAKTQKVVEKRSKLSPEAKVARELAKAAIAKAKQNQLLAVRAEKFKAKQDAKAAKLAEKEAAKALKLKAKEDAKAAKLAEKAAAKAIADAAKAEAKAAKQALRDEARAIKLAEQAAIKIAKLADKAAEKEVKLCEKLLKKVLSVHAGPDAEWGTLGHEHAAFIAATEGMNSTQLTALISEKEAAKKASVKAAKAAEKEAAKAIKLAAKADAKRAKIVAEIHDLASRIGVKFGENEVENADMGGLKEIRKTLKKSIRKLERADQAACVAAQVSADGAKFDREMASLPIC